MQVCNVWPMHLVALGWHATHSPLKQTEVAPAHAACATHCPPVHFSGTIVGEHSTAFSVQTGVEPLDAPLEGEPLAPDVPLVEVPDEIDPEVAPLDPLLPPVVASLTLLGESSEAASMSAPEPPDWPDVASAVPPLAPAEGPLDPLEGLSVVVPFAHAAQRAPKPSQAIRLMSSPPKTSMLIRRLAGARKSLASQLAKPPPRTCGSAVVEMAASDEHDAGAIHTHARSKSCKGARCKAPPLATETSSSSRER